MDSKLPQAVGNRALLFKFFDSNPSVSFVRFYMMNHASRLQVSIMPKEAALDIAETGFFASPGSPYAAASTIMETLVYEHLQLGVDNIIPDWDSLKVCTFYPAHALAMCSIQEPLGYENQASAIANDGFELCPRTILSKQVARADRAGQDLLIGLELEFMIYEDGTDFTNSPVHAYPTSLYGKYAPIMDEIVLNIGDAGIKVLKWHTEGGSEGVFEIVLAPYTPLQAADAMIFCREAIKTVVKKHGLEATLMPTPFDKGADLGLHTNISISDPSNGKAHHFLAGVLESLVAISAFGMPSVESGLRARRWQGWVMWGKANKGCVVVERRDGLWEIRCPDGTMNPYLTFAAIIACGMTGLETRTKLTLKPMDLMMKTATEGERKDIGIEHKISESLGELIDALKNDLVLRSAGNGFGERCVDFYTAIKTKEIEDSADLEPQERKRRLRCLF